MLYPTRAQTSVRDTRHRGTVLHVLSTTFMVLKYANRVKYCCCFYQKCNRTINYLVKIPCQDAFFNNDNSFLNILNIIFAHLDYLK